MRFVTVLPLIIGLWVTTTIQAAEPEPTENSLRLPLESRWQYQRFGNDLRVRGLKLGADVYIGQAKVSGQYGLGIVIDKGSWQWGLNHQGMAIRFALD